MSNLNLERLVVLLQLVASFFPILRKRNRDGNDNVDTAASNTVERSVFAMQTTVNPHGS